MRWLRSDNSWIWLGCALPLIGCLFLICIAVWAAPSTDFTLKPLQLDSSNPLLGQWRVIASCDTPELPTDVLFDSTGTWQSVTDPSIHGTYQLHQSNQVDIGIAGVQTRFTIRHDPYALVLWTKTAHHTLVRDTIQFSKCGGAN